MSAPVKKQQASSSQQQLFSGTKSVVERNLAEAMMAAVVNTFLEADDGLTEFTAQNLVQWERNMHTAVAFTAQAAAETQKSYMNIYKEMKTKTIPELKEECKKLKILYHDRFTAERELAHRRWEAENDILLPIKPAKTSTASASALTKTAPTKPAAKRKA